MSGTTIADRAPRIVMLSAIIQAVASLAHARQARLDSRRANTGSVGGDTMTTRERMIQELRAHAIVHGDVGR